jgi:hypothetical protein
MPESWRRDASRVRFTRWSFVSGEPKFVGGDAVRHGLGSSLTRLACGGSTVSRNSRPGRDAGVISLSKSLPNSSHWRETLGCDFRFRNRGGEVYWGPNIRQHLPTILGKLLSYLQHPVQAVHLASIV